MHIKVTRILAYFRRCSVRQLILPVFLITFTLFVFFSGVLVVPVFLDQNSTSNRDDIAKAILSAALSLSAMSLAVFGYSMSKIKSVRGTKAKRPYRRIGFLVYFVISLGLADALASASYILFKDYLFFCISLVLFLIILYGIIGSVTLWATKEL